MNLIEQYLQETPAKMGEIIEKSEDLFSGIRGESFDRIIVTGSGTSFHAAQQTLRYMQGLLSAEVMAFYPFMITERLFGNRTLLIGLSQGGSSISTYNAMKLARENGAITASMSGTDNALVDEAADHTFKIHCGEEKAGAKTKGYYCTKLNLMLFALYMSRSHGRVLPAEFDGHIGRVVKAKDRYMTVYRQSEEWLEKNRENLLNTKEMRVIGTADLYGDALEGALKLLETMRAPATGYEFEEFIHGIYNAVDEKSTLFIMDSGVEDRVAKLTKALSEWTQNIHVIGRNVENNGKNLRADVVEDKDYHTFNFLIPIQLICAKIPPLLGIEPSVPKDTRFHTKLGSKRA